MPFPFATHKANGTAVFTHGSSFPLKIHLERAFLPAVRGFLQSFSCFLSFRRRGKSQCKKNKNLSLFPTNHEKGKMTGIFPSLFSNTGKNQKRRMKTEISFVSPSTDSRRILPIGQQKSSKSFQTYCFSLPPVAVGYSISFTNWDLSIQPSINPVFPRHIAYSMFKPYVFSLVFALTSRNKGNILFSADHFIQQSCGSTLCFPCSVSVNVHCGTDISVSEKFLHIFWGSSV